MFVDYVENTVVRKEIIRSGASRKFYLKIRTRQTIFKLYIQYRRASLFFIPHVTQQAKRPLKINIFEVLSCLLKSASLKKDFLNCSSLAFNDA